MLADCVAVDLLAVDVAVGVLLCAAGWLVAVPVVFAGVELPVVVVELELELADVELVEVELVLALLDELVLSDLTSIVCLID